MATKSDFYTHVTDIPPQYGDGHFSNEAQQTGFRRYCNDILAALLTVMTALMHTHTAIALSHIIHC
jgi:hypothetical protein